MAEPAVPTDAEIAACVQELLARRADGRTICPSEAARALSTDWRPLMPRVRAVAAAMAAEGRLCVLQKGRVIDAAQARGPVRLGLPARD